MAELRVLNDEEIREKVLPYCDRNGRTYNPYLRGALGITKKAQFQADIKAFVEWGEEDCPHRMMADFTSKDPKAPDISLRKKADCPQCWQSLKQLVEKPDEM